MSAPALITTEKKSELPVLIVDRVGVIGKVLAENIKQESLVILVSGKSVDDPNIIHVPYDKKIPTIPDNTYSHIFLIDEDGILSKQIISPFLKKAEHDESELVLIVRKGMIDKKYSENFISLYDKARLVITGEIFAKDFIFDKTDINKFIKQAKENNKIEIEGDGTRETWPVFFDDVIWGILQAGFIEEEREKIFLVFPQGGFTLLSIARIFQKINPDLKIDFIKEGNRLVRLVVEEEVGGKNLLEERYDLDSKIKQIDFEKERFEEIERNEVHQTPFQISLPSGLNRFFAASFLIISLVLLMPIIFTLSSAALGGLLLQGAKSQAEAGRLDSARNFVTASYFAFAFSENAYSLVEKEARTLGLDGKASNLFNKIEQGKEASFAARGLLESISKIENIFTGSSKVTEKEFNNVTNDIKSAIVYYQKQKETGTLPLSLTKNLDEIVNISSATIETWPQLLGFKGTRKYLILLQNNMELRPGGGFIGSFALASLDKGRLTNFKIYDVYDADGQLKGHIEPPFAIRRYLNSPNWYLRDSNFDIDFSKSAQASAVFLLSELKQPVDGVIALDLSFVRNLLDKIGEVKVADYNETVSSNNLFQVTQKRVETNFFPGSTQKKDFLKSLYNSIEKKLSTDRNISYLNVLQSAVESIAEKHLMFAFNKANTQALFSVNGWGGTLFDDRENTSSSINDFVGINEANFGANKVNYYISRSVNITATIKESGELENNLKISFKNNSPKNSGIKGLYKNYLRIILPGNSTLSKIEIDGVQQKLVDAVTQPNIYEAKNFKPPAGLEVDRQVEEGKSIFGLLINIEPEALRNVVVTYTLAKKLDLKQASHNYSIKVYKQPGVDSIPIGFSLNLPTTLSLVDYPKNSNKKENGATFADTLVKDTIYNFTLSKK